MKAKEVKKRLEADGWVEFPGTSSGRRSQRISILNLFGQKIRRIPIRISFPAGDQPGLWSSKLSRIKIRNREGISPLPPD